MDVLGVQMWDRFSEFLWAVQNHQNTTCRGAFGVGKSFGVAVICLWFLFTRYSSRVITTAPTQRQVRDILWADIQHLWRNAGPIIDGQKYNISLGGECLTDRLKITEKWFAIGFTARDYNESSFQGYHAPAILYVIDEATGVSPAIFAARDKLILGRNDRFICIGNPIDPICDFARTFKDPTFAKLRIPAEDTPNVKQGTQVIPGMVTREWVEDKRNRWGEGSQLWLSRVEAEFPEGSEDALIPLAWIEKAFERWETMQGHEHQGDRTMGVDVATTGNDETVFIKLIGNYVESIKTWRGKDTQEIGILAEAEAGKEYRLAVDSIGVGAGVSDYLYHRGIPVIRVIGSEHSDTKDSTGTFGFANRRTELWWSLRELLDPKGCDPLALPRDEMLLEDLATPTWKQITGGKIQVEPKDKLCERLGRSPDRGDALAVALAARAAQAAMIAGTQSMSKYSREQTKAQRRW